MSEPVLDLSTYNAPTAKPVDVTFTPLSPTAANVIDLRTTPVTDGVNTGYLSSIFKLASTATDTSDTPTSKLVIDGQTALVTDGSFNDDGDLIVALFDFKYDPDGEKMGAGTAFLQD